MAKKIELAVDIFTKHLPTRESTPKREWRAKVVAEIAETLGVTNKGTLGMYFAWSDQLVSGRSAKQYNVTAPRRSRKGAEQEASPVETKPAPKAAARRASETSNIDQMIARMGAPATKPAKSGSKKTIPNTGLTGSL